MPTISSVVPMGCRMNGPEMPAAHPQFSAAAVFSGGVGDLHERAGLQPVLAGRDDLLAVLDPVVDRGLVLIHQA